MAVSGVVQADVFHDYENLSEGFLGTTFTADGVTYHDVNNVSGFYPDGNPFDNDDNGDQVIIEDATLLYNDFPGYGSSHNGMTFGSAFIPGENLSIGALASVWMDLDFLGNSADLDIAFYENGPWGGVIYHLDGVLNGDVVASTTYEISNLGGRDNPNWTSLSISGANFDSLHLYATWNGFYSAPRGMIDNLAITEAVPEPASLCALALGGAALLRRRRRSSK